MAHELDVIVVGAGISGLIATTVLHQQGAEVVCLEARERVGGRALSTNGWIDLGATWFWDGQAAITETVHSLELATYEQVLDGDALIEQTPGQAVRLDGNPIDRRGWRLHGGMQSLPLELAHRLPPATVRTSAAVQSITFEADGAVSVETGSEEFSASTVVLAVPPKLAVESIELNPAAPPGLLQAAQAVHTWMSDTVKVIARFEEPFWREAGLAGAALSHAGPFCEFHDHSGPEPGEAALFGFAPAAQLGGAAPDEIAARFQAQIARLFGPGASDILDLQIADWSSDPLTSTPAPARPSTLWYYGIPLLRLPHYDGRLLFGSTETAPAFPGYLEGAVLAGRRAAGQALERRR